MTGPPVAVDFTAIDWPQVTQQLHGCSVFPPNLFGDRDMIFVAVDKRFDCESAVIGPRSDGITIEELVQVSAGLAIN